MLELLLESEADLADDRLRDPQMEVPLEDGHYPSQLFYDTHPLLLGIA